MDRVEPRLPPQRRIDRVGRLFGVQESIGPAVPDDLAILAGDQPACDFGELAAHSVLEILRVVQRQPLGKLGLRRARRSRRRILRPDVRSRQQHRKRHRHPRLFHRIPSLLPNGLRPGPGLGKRAA